jgi:hypothetical protein
MTQPLQNHPLCTSINAKPYDGTLLAFYIESGTNDDYAEVENLEDVLALYDKGGLPYTMTILTPHPPEEWDNEPEGWQSPTVDERNPFAFL